MPAIGFVAKQTDGSFAGYLRTLTVNVRISIVPNERKLKDHHPDYIIYTESQYELGAGWIKTNTSTKAEYLSLTLAAPELGKPLYANLGRAPQQEDTDHLAIIWNPPADKDADRPPRGTSKARAWR